MTRYDVVLLSCGQVELTDACVRSVLANSSDFRLIWIENAPQCTAYWRFHGKAPILYLPQESNLGFTCGANIGLRAADAPFVVILNDDTEVPPGWLEALETGFREIPKLAAIGTLSTSPRQWQYVANAFGGFVPSDCERARLLPHGQTRIIEPHFSVAHTAIGGPFLAFFCTMFSRESLDGIGLFDERFSPGFGEDDDWCARAHLAGWKLALHTGVLVRHVHRASWLPEKVKELQARNARLLKEKYAAFLS